MRTYTLSLIISSALLGGTLTNRAERVQFNDLPASVQRTINAQVGAAGISSIDKTERNGVAFYEVRTSQTGAKPFYVSETGSVINPDNVISSRRGQDGSRKATFAELPASVQNTVRGQAGTAPVEDIDIVTKNGQTTYEVAFKRDGKTAELVLDPQGQIVSGAAPAAVPVSQARVPLAAGTKVNFEQLPAAVQNTLRTYTKGARIEDIDKGTLQGKTIYEAAFKHQGQHVELRVAEDGAVVRDDVNDRFLTSIGQTPGQTNDRLAAQSSTRTVSSRPSRMRVAS